MQLFNKEDANRFAEETNKTSIRVSASISSLLLAGMSPQGIVFGLLKVAAYIAKHTACAQDVFVSLANLAYKQHSEDGTEKPDKKDEKAFFN